MRQRLKRHPHLYAIGGVLMVIGGGLATIEGIWSLFSSEPLIPFVLRFTPDSSDWFRWLFILFFGLLTIVGIILLIAIFRQTKSRTSLGYGIQPTVRAKIIKSKDEYANIEVKPLISGNRAVLEVKNIGIDADFTANAIVVKGVLSNKRYTMCWDSPPHLEHPIKKWGTSTIIVAEKTSAIMGMETPGIVKNGLLLYIMGISGEVERVGVTTEELSNTVKLNIMYPTMAKPVDDSCTIEITITSTPPLLNAFENQRYKIEIDHEQGHKLLIAPLPELETHIKLDVVKLLLDGKEILVDLEKMNGQLDAAGAASAELKFEIWYKDVSKTLQNTDYDRLWFENKEGLDYRKAKKSDYIETCKYGLDRLENIKQLIFYRGDSQA